MRLLLALAALLPLTASALTADELVAKNLEARGGAAKLHALKSMRASGKLRFDGGGGQVEASLASVATGGKVRESVTVMGFENIYAYDGKGGWQIEPGGGRKDPERMSADDAKPLVEDANFTGLLSDWKAKGFKLQYLGTEDVDGTDAHKLKVTRPNGDFHYVFLDPDHFLEIRVETHRWVRGAEQVSETDFGEYEQVNGTYWPFMSVQGPKGSGNKQTSLIDTLELDVPVEDAVFAMPGTGGKK